MIKAGRISDVKTFLIGGDRWGWVVVKVETEDGLYGVGEASLEGRELTVAAAIGELRRYFVGKKAGEIERHYRAVFREAIWSGGAILQSALSGVEMALWDLKGKRLGVPVYELLGGKVRDEIRLYANGWFYKGGSPNQVAEAAKAMVGEGFLGLKLNPFNKIPDVDPAILDDRILRRGVEYMAAVREIVGPDIQLCVDLNATFNNIGDVLRITQALRPFNIAFLEEPLFQENYQQLAYLRSQAGIPIASGERFFSPFEFHCLLGAGGVDVVQPDLCHCGGISAARKIAARADLDYVPVAPHNPNGPVCAAAGVHIAAATTNFLALEFFRDDKWRDEVIGRPFEVANGFIQVPDKPGLGIDFDEEGAARHPFVPKDLIGFHRPTFTAAGNN